MRNADDKTLLPRIMKIASYITRRAKEIYFADVVKS